MQRVIGQPGIWALWGSPGRGKSTYLSYAVNHLHSQQVPTIRHHYFLSLADSGDRNSFADIASSLMDQMVVRSGDAVKGLEDNPIELRKWVEACGAHWGAQGKRFVVVVDGLDHVTREYADLSQMNQLFNALLPCPPNVTVLVGTQKVADHHLPLRLIQHATSESWIEVPQMDRDAVQRWVVLQHRSGRVLLSNVRATETDQHELGAIGDALYDISLGHPLHLIYSFEAMVRRGLAFSLEEIGRLPSCPEGDIRKYYAGLWRGLSPSAKQTIHAMAGSGFRWTEDGLRRCFGPIDEIDHLLEFQRSGVAPFHGSLLAFAVERDDHAPSFKALLPRIMEWLKNDAPKLQRWGWYWIIEALNGDEHDLLRATTRQWVVDSLVEGWPSRQIIEILSRAEELAFSHDDYVRATELRALKTRLDNGPKFQVQQFGDFSEVAIRTALNIESVIFSADQLGSLGSDEILTLVKTVPDRSSDIIEVAFEELRRRVNLWIELRHHSDRDFEVLVGHFLEVAAIFPQTESARVITFLKGFRVDARRNSSFRAFVSYLRKRSEPTSSFKQQSRSREAMILPGDFTLKTPLSLWLQRRGKMSPVRTHHARR
ncbi:NACHT domain-containing protein [Mesorhizobium sp. ORM6]